MKYLGDCDGEKYPLQLKNRPSLEYLREIAHLRFRTNTFGAVFRVRHTLAFAVHKFFNDKNFVYLHTPIITASDAEGAGEMFRVTTLPLDNPPKSPDGAIDFKEDFFGRPPTLPLAASWKANWEQWHLVIFILSALLSGRKIPILPAPCGILDDRTRNGIL